MSVVVDGLLAVTMVAGALLCWLGYDTYRRREGPGAAAFGAFVAAWGAIPVLTGGVSFFWEDVGTLAGILWILATIPWFVFALQYTGIAFRPRTLVVVVLPSLGLGPWLLSVSVGIGGGLFEAVGVLVFIYYSALAVFGSGLVLWVTQRYGHIPLRQGFWLALAGVLPPAAMNSFGILIGETSQVVLYSIYTASVLGVLLAVGLAVFRYDLFDATPATGTFGERAVARETDDLILIVDERGRMVRRNERAERELDDAGASIGDPVAELLGVGVAELRERETVEIQTRAGVRKFDPQVSELTDQHGRSLGSMVSLRDVTEREMRRQRLEVLNRLIRHNLRNRLGVIKANTEAVTDEITDEELVSYLESTEESADALQDMGRKAKAIEELLSREERTVADVSLAALLEEVEADAAERWPAAAVRIERAPEETIETDPDALRFVVENLVENAIEHTDRTQPVVELAAAVDEDADRYPVTITVADDGPGIPSREIEVLREGAETPLKHGSGVGLWVTNWAVTDLGGELAFDDREPRGSVVRVRLPHEPR